MATKRLTASPWADCGPLKAASLTGWTVSASSACSSEAAALLTGPLRGVGASPVVRAWVGAV